MQPDRLQGPHRRLRSHPDDREYREGRTVELERARDMGSSQGSGASDHEAGRRHQSPGWHHFHGRTRARHRHNGLNMERLFIVLLAFIPITVVAEVFGASHVWLFILSALAIIPLAKYIGESTEELS